tara:strand:+ start:573 stop:860 length:288 start_codon:yes stop_codon:yes gene_type:complete
MAVKISEDTNVQLDLKTIGVIIGFVISLATVFFTLKADIALAKELPKPPITRSEYDLKDQLVREQIMNTGAQVMENGKKLDLIEKRLYELSIKKN